MKIKNIILVTLILTFSCSPAFAMQPQENLDNKKASAVRRNVSDNTKTDANFLPVSDLLSEIITVEKELLTPQTPDQKKALTAPQSAPAKVSHKGEDKSTNNTFMTPVQHKQPRASLTDPLPKKEKKPEDIYADQQNVSKKFLDHQKRDFISKKAQTLFDNFTKDYQDKKNSILDITGLSGRSRVYLLQSIINFKINYLPAYIKADGSKRTYADFCSWELKDNYWQKHITPSGGIAEFIDLVPTTFKIGDFSYKLQQGATFHQKGSGRLFGLLSPDTADTYEQIYKKLEKYGEEQIKYFSTLLLKQKKEGVVINTNNIGNDRFINGLNLLLDYEVARRLATDDKFGDLPIIFSVEFIIKNLHNKIEINKMMVKKETSLFAGDTRANNAQNLIPKLGPTQNSKRKIRSSLTYLHLSDEDSEDEYSGDEEDIVPLKIRVFDDDLLTLAPDQLQPGNLQLNSHHHAPTPQVMKLPIKDFGSTEENFKRDLVDLNTLIKTIEFLKTAPNTENMINEKVREFNQIVSKIPEMYAKDSRLTLLEIMLKSLREQ